MKHKTKKKNKTKKRRNIRREEERTGGFKDVRYARQPGGKRGR